MICDLQEDHPVCPLMPDQHHRKDDHRDYLGYDQGCSGNGKYLDGWARVNIQEKGVLPASCPQSSPQHLRDGTRIIVHTYNYVSIKLEGMIMKQLLAFPIFL